MFCSARRRLIVCAAAFLAVSMAVVGAGSAAADPPGLADPTPASSSTPAVPGTGGPPPCVFGVCVPWVWYEATSVINNQALLPLPAFGASLDNNTTDPAMLTDTVTGSITVKAELTGNFGVAGDEVAGAVATLMPNVGVSATLTLTKTVEITVPPGDQGVILFGVPAVEVNGVVHSRDFFGHITDTPAQAWAPLYPTVFGFSAYVTPLVGGGPGNEFPVIPIPV